MELPPNALQAGWRPAMRTRTFTVLLAVTLTAALSCAVQAPGPRRATGGANSPLCDALLGQFLPLPDQTRAPAAAAGRWWIRGCRSEAVGAEIRATLSGPAWFWVRADAAPFHIRQHVYFQVRAALRGNIDPRIGSKAGLISLWFRTTRTEWQVQPKGRVRPRADNALGSALRFLAAPLPGLNVEDRAKARLELEATRRFRAAVEQGFTVVYDVSLGQADVAVGLLPEGTKPERPFDDGRAWLANERLLAAPGGFHVLGPFAPGQPLALDARIVRGFGLRWQAVCDSDVDRALATVERGEEATIAAAAIHAEGALLGRGSREAELAALSCRSYVLVWPNGPGLTEADVRVRAM